MAKVTIRFHETTPQQRKKMIRDLGKHRKTTSYFSTSYGLAAVELPEIIEQLP
jgi:hypothetical protein